MANLKRTAMENRSQESRRAPAQNALSRWNARTGPRQSSQTAGVRADVTLSEIEKTQAALRESIEQAKDLAAQPERLIKKQRKEIKRAN